MAKGSGQTRTATPVTTSRYTPRVVATPYAGPVLGGSAPAIPLQPLTTETDKKRWERSMPISLMKNRDMQKEIQQAISRYEAVIGLPTRRISLIKMKPYGKTFMSHKGPEAVYISKEFFDRPKKVVEAEYKKSNYVRRHGFKNVTRKPSQHTITHELAHATWDSYYTSPKHIAAGNEIKAPYKTFKADKSSSRKKNYGTYGHKNVDEFWAEIITKAVHGDSDNYTRKALAIVKRHKL